MTTRVLCVVMLAPILLAHTVDLFAQNTVVSWSALDMGLASPASATTKVLSVAGQVIAGPLRFANTMIESGFLADTLLRGSVTTGINEEPLSTLPTEFRLEQNYPNPFNPSTQILVALPHESHIRLIVYNIVGQEIITLADEQRPAGYFTVEWNGSTLSGSKVSSGVYFYRLEAKPVDVGNTFVSMKKMILLK